MSSLHSKRSLLTLQHDGMQDKLSPEENINHKLKALCTLHGDLPSPESINPAEVALYTTDQFSLEENEASTTRFNAIYYSFKYHFEHNAFYKRFCESAGVLPHDIKDIENVNRIPLIPEHIFKGCSGPEEFIAWLTSITTDEINWPEPGALQGSYDEQIGALRHKYRILVRSTSGSSGIPSFLPRDSITSRRSAHWKIISYSAMNPEILSHDNLISVTLWPLDFSWADLIVPPERVHALLDKKLGLETVIRAMTRPPDSQGIIDRLLGRKEKGYGHAFLDNLVSKLTEIANTGSPGIIWSPPFLIYTLAVYLLEKKLKLRLGTLWKIELGGGWKLLHDRPLSERELQDLVSEALSVPNGNIHDIYGSTECLGLCGLSCEGGYKHIPHSVLHPIVLNENNEPAGYGQWGRFAFLNPLIRSYPGFIVTGDRVRMWQVCPACSRRGPVLDSEISRMADAEDRGCANIVREIVNERISK